MCKFSTNRHRWTKSCSMNRLIQRCEAAHLVWKQSCGHQRAGRDSPVNRGSILSELYLLAGRHNLSVSPWFACSNLVPSESLLVLLKVFWSDEMKAALTLQSKCECICAETVKSTTHRPPWTQEPRLNPFTSGPADLRPLQHRQTFSWRLSRAGRWR